jgi:hypothetical protein
MFKFIPLTLLISITLLQGCATPAVTIYNWGPYESQVYSHFKGESPESQIQILERHAEAAKSGDKPLPPGYMAHLGFLYAKVGRDADFVTALEIEKQRFPESSSYMNYLLRNTKKGAPDNAK